jgi:hypothetical protein
MGLGSTQWCFARYGMPKFYVGTS